MKHLIQKSEQSEEILGKQEIIDIIQSTSELIFIKHGVTADSKVRKSFSESVHEIFPQVSTAIIDAKLSQRMRNMRRPGKQNKWQNVKEMTSTEAKVTDSRNATDYEDFVKVFNVGMKEASPQNPAYEIKPLLKPK